MRCDMKQNIPIACVVNRKIPLLGLPLIFALIVGCSRAASGLTENNGKNTIEGKGAIIPGKTVWSCSMHPQIRQDHPGDCPICGMALVPVAPLTYPKSPDTTPASVSYPLITMDEGLKSKQSGSPVIQLVPAQRAEGRIGTSPVEEKAVLHKVELLGEITFITDKQIDFTWYYGGRVEKTLVDYNTTEIKEGTPLLEVYSEEAVAAQRDCLEMMMDLRKHLVSEQKVFESEYGTNTQRVTLVGMSYEHKNLSARLNATKDRLIRIGMTEGDFQALENTGKIRSLFSIKAPESGSLLGGLPHVGSRFTMDTFLFRLAPLKEVWFEADVYEQDLSLLQLGQEIAIRSKLTPEKVFKGKMVFIGKEVDPRKRTVKARFLVPNPEGLLLPQLTATGMLTVGGEAPQLAVPASAIIDTGRRQLVYVETSPNTFEMRSVKVGAEGELSTKGEMGAMKWVPVLDGLHSGEKVVTSGAFLIDAEAQLRGLPASGADPGLNQP